MFSAVTLAPEVEDFLRNLSVPVRVLDGNAGRLDPPGWSGHVRATGRTRRECNEDGLTIVSWGTDHDPANGHATAFIYVGIMPGDFYANGCARNLSREFIADRRCDERSYIPYDYTFARFDSERRVVWFNFSLAPHAQGGLDLDGVDLYKIIGEPIQRVLGADRRLPRTTDRARDLFLENAARAQTGPIQRIERTLREQRNHVASYTEHIRNAYSEIRRLESELAVQRRVTTVCRARLEERWEALVAHPMLTRIVDDGTTLVLTTTPLDIENPDTGETNYLGVIDIKLRHSDYGLSLTFTNTDNAGQDADGWAHPHCVQNCGPCWGGSEGRAGDLLASHDLPAIVELALQFLQSYNPGDSWGSSHAHMWGFDGSNEEDEVECTCSECLRDREAA